jgi:hypothetical protein
MRDIPITVLAAFPPPNYDHPHTRGHALIVTNGVLIAISVLVVSIRFYTRIAIKRSFGSDDTFIGLALVDFPPTPLTSAESYQLCAIGLTTAVLLGNIRYGWDRHIWDMPLDLVTSALKMAFVSKILFSLAATFTRLSLLCFYSRLVVNSGIRWFNTVIVVSHGFVVMVGVVFVGLTVWQCR